MTFRKPHITPQVGVKGFAPDQIYTDINLYPNPIPVNNSVSLMTPSVHIRVTTSDATDPSEMWLYPPFYPPDMSYSKIIPDWLPPPTYPNLIIRQPVVVVSPFYTQDFSTTKVIPDWLPNYAPQAYNPNLYTNPIPFAQHDWSKPQGVSDRLPDQVYPNTVLLNPVIVQNPFFLQDFSTTKTLPGLPPLVYPYNVDIYTNPKPFGPYDYNKSYSIKPVVSDQNNLPNLVLRDFSTPFYLQDFSTSHNIPDWLPPPTYPNLLLIQPSSNSTPLGIFGWTDWNKVKSPVIIVPDEDNLPNLVLIINPPPPPPPEQPQGGGKYPSQWLKDYEKLVRDQRTDIKEAAAVLSRAGGLARAKALSPKQRSAIASLAAKTRWK